MDYSKIAPSYNELYSSEQLKKLEIIRKLLDIKQSHKLLDVGCGTGISTGYFSQKCHVTGIDPCKELLAQTKQNCIQGKAENLPFEDNSFDIVISVTSIHNFDSFEKGIKEMKRVLNKNGQLVVSVMKRSSKLDDIEEELKNTFSGIKTIEEEKDIIFYTNTFK
jgi:ubiquinone/menaquinone biosynthesis C-methylase UbiE